jgi:hypothetical protein
MANAPDLDCVVIAIDENEAVVSNAQSKFFSALQGFNVTEARFRKSMQCRQNPHRNRFAQSSDIISRGIAPDNPFHFGS